jgi:hypothetical protein
MPGRNLTRRLERLEARAALEDQQVSIMVRFVDSGGGVKESLVLECRETDTRCAGEAEQT